MPSSPWNVHSTPQLQPVKSSLLGSLGGSVRRLNREASNALQKFDDLATTLSNAPTDNLGAASKPCPASNEASETMSRGISGREDPYSFLPTLDTTVLIDDSGSMAGRSWREVSQALSTIAPIVTKHDSDGIDIYFLNHKSNHPGVISEGNADSAERHVEGISGKYRSLRGPAAGTRVDNILNPFLAKYELQPEGEDDAPSPGRSKPIPKPDRQVTKGEDGRFVCGWVGCTEEIRAFNRKCEWSKHMDKHDRPYKCFAEGCEKLPGFTYSGGLYRHMNYHRLYKCPAEGGKKLPGLTHSGGLMLPSDDSGVFRRHRRGHRIRRRDATEDFDKKGQTPFSREFHFRSPKDTSSMPGRGLLDSQSQIPFAVSRRWLIEAGYDSEISTDFKAPSSISISGHVMNFTGIIRNLVFNPKGSNVTYRRDFLVCDQLDTVTDFLFGAKFMLEQWSVLFGIGKMKRMIAGWFTHKKETPEEKAQAQVLKANQEQEAHEAELRLRARKAHEAREKEARKRQQQEAEGARNRQ